MLISRAPFKAPCSTHVFRRNDSGPQTNVAGFLHRGQICDMDIFRSWDREGFRYVPMHLDERTLEAAV